MQNLIEIFSHPQAYLSLLTLTVMEIVLGIDNIIFISILTGKLPKDQQPLARKLGLLLALFFRIMLLLFIAWIAGLTKPWFTVLGWPISGRDFILISGGLFLIAKSTSEIHSKLEGHEHLNELKKQVSFASVIFQIILLDIVFSFDSVITAVGLVKEITIMIIAVVLSLIVMLIFAGTVSDFVNKHPTIKMLALSFLLMIGVLLFAEGFHQEIPKGYVYFAMAFSVFVEFLNLKVRATSDPKHVG